MGIISLALEKGFLGRRELINVVWNPRGLLVVCFLTGGNVDDCTKDSFNRHGHEPADELYWVVIGA